MDNSHPDNIRSFSLERMDGSRRVDFVRDDIGLNNTFFISLENQWMEKEMGSVQADKDAL